MDAYQLDDMVSSVLSQLTGQRVEHIGVMYREGEELKSTEPQSTGQRKAVKANVIIPKGGLRALFHNHPATRQSARDLKTDRPDGGEVFSDDDKDQARRLGVPSYILTPTGRVLRFDPKTGKVDEVLAQIQLPVRSQGAHNTLVP